MIFGQFILVFLCFQLVLVVRGYTFPPDYHGLQELYDSAGGNYWIYYGQGSPWSFTSGSDPCGNQWEGVFCNNTAASCALANTSCSVQAIVLQAHNLTGTIPDTMFGNSGSLLGLGALVFFNNLGLSGTLPSSMCQLLYMNRLIISTNALSGSIPECFFPAPNVYTSGFRYISDLDLARNAFTGTLSSNIGQMQMLHTLIIGDTFIQGTIPLELLTCTQLENLLLFGSSITGTLPDNFYSSFPYLKIVIMNSNNLYGTIPPFYNLTNLTTVMLFDNFFSGTLPTSLVNSSKLKYMFVSENHLSGKPDHLLRHNNYETGDPQFPALEYLDISKNEFSGTIPYEIFSLPSLNTLAAAVNCFSGAITDELCTLPGMRVLVLDALNTAEACRTKSVWEYLFGKGLTISGSVPSCIWQLKNLTILHLAGNLLTGSLDGTEGLYELGNPASHLKVLSLSYNRIGGVIPSPIQRWRKFETLDLTQNEISGDISEMQGMLKVHSQCLDTYAINCTSLYLKNNRLSGDIPSSFRNGYPLQILDGNLFQCRENTIPVYDPQKEGYICGSTSLNVSLYIWIAIFLLFFVITCSLLYVVVKNISFRQLWEGNFDIIARTTERIYKNSVSFTDYIHRMVRMTGKIVLWYRACASLRKERKSLVQAARFMRLLAHLQRTTVILIVFLVVIALPSYSVLKRDYSTHEFQYLWLYSATMMSGSVPGVIYILMWFVAVTIFGIATRGFYYSTRLTKILRSYDYMVSKIAPGKAIFQNNNGVLGFISVMFSRLPKRRQIFIIFSFLFALNFFVVGSMKYAYLLTLQGNFDYKVIILAQVFFALFDLAWNWGVMRYIVNLVRNVLEFSQNTTVFLKSIVFAFNSVLVPCAVIIAFERNCLADLFFPPSKVVSTYNVEFCSPFVGGCQIFQKGDGFTPPFVYNYQCSTSIIVDYVPVLIFTYTMVGFLLPAYFLFAINYRHLIHNHFMHAFPKIFWPGMTASAITPGLLASAVAATYSDPGIFIAAEGRASAETNVNSALLRQEIENLMRNSVFFKVNMSNEDEMDDDILAIDVLESMTVEIPDEIPDENPAVSSRAVEQKKLHRSLNNLTVENPLFFQSLKHSSNRLARSPSSKTCASDCGKDEDEVSASPGVIEMKSFKPKSVHNAENVDDLQEKRKFALLQAIKQSSRKLSKRFSSDKTIDSEFLSVDEESDERIVPDADASKLTVQSLDSAENLLEVGHRTGNTQEKQDELEDYLEPWDIMGEGDGGEERESNPGKTNRNFKLRTEKILSVEGVLRSRESIRRSFRVGFKKRILKPDIVIVQCINHYLIMLTFGLVSPILAAVVGISLLISLLFWQVIIGRYIFFLDDFFRTQLQEMSSQMIQTGVSAEDVALKLPVPGKSFSLSPGLVILLSSLEKECHNSWNGTKHSEALIMIVSSFLIAFILVDVLNMHFTSYKVVASISVILYAIALCIYGGPLFNWLFPGSTERSYARRNM